MNKKYDWDLEYLLKDETIDDLFLKWEKNLQNLIDSKNAFCDTKKLFEERLKLELENSIISNRLINYVSNHLNEDTKNKKWIEWSQKISNKLNNYSQQTSDLNNIVLKNEANIRNYLKDSKLSEYVRDFELFFKNKKRILSNKEEKIISDLSVTDSGFEDIYSAVVDSTIKYEDAIDKNGKAIKIPSMAKAFKLLKSNDQILRKNAWISFSKVYYENRYILTQTLIYNYKMLNANAKIRKYSSYIDMVADDDEVNIDFIKKIYKGVESFKTAYKKYGEIKNEILKKTHKLTKLHPWDKNLDVVKFKDKHTIDSIKEQTIDSLKCLGKEYISVIERAFQERWISWLPKDGKHSGAYSIGGTYGLSKYFISMNFDETINSLYTLVHELGHSLNSYYYGKKQTVHCSCSIFYAEISSITNELILSYDLLNKAKNNKEKLFIVDKILSGFFATTTRQVIFSNFEYEIVNRELNNEPITYEIIEETYGKMNEKYTGNEFKNKNSKIQKYSLVTILRIDHFYVGNFYVYKYAIGQICAMYIARKIYEGDKETLSRFYKFLESGSSLSPIDTIKILGIDFDNDDVWKECIKNVDYFIDMYKELARNK